MVTTLLARNENEAMVGSGGVCVWWESVVWSQAVVFCVGVFGRNLASVTMNMFSHLMCFIKKNYKFCTFHMI
jgi:hypothetical protein